MNRGFSLIELIVSLGVFALAALIGVSSLLIMVTAQRKAINIQSAYDNVRYTLEIMSKEIRTGDVYYCGAFFGLIADLAPNDCIAGGAGAQAITFINALGKMISYRYNTAVVGGNTIGILERKIDAGVYEQVSGNDINIQDIRFFVTGSKPSADEIAAGQIPFHAVITVIAKGSVGVGRSLSQFSLQTSITQRAIRQ